MTNEENKYNGLPGIPVFAAPIHDKYIQVEDILIVVKDRIIIKDVLSMTGTHVIYFGDNGDDRLELSHDMLSLSHRDTESDIKDSYKEGLRFLHDNGCLFMKSGYRYIKYDNAIATLFDDKAIVCYGPRHYVIMENNSWQIYKRDIE